MIDPSLEILVFMKTRWVSQPVMDQLPPPGRSNRRAARERGRWRLVWLPSPCISLSSRKSDTQGNVYKPGQYVGFPGVRQQDSGWADRKALNRALLIKDLITSPKGTVWVSSCSCSFLEKAILFNFSSLFLSFFLFFILLQTGSHQASLELTM